MTCSLVDVEWLPLITYPPFLPSQKSHIWLWHFAHQGGSGNVALVSCSILKNHAMLAMVCAYGFALEILHLGSCIHLPLFSFFTLTFRLHFPLQMTWCDWAILKIPPASYLVSELQKFLLENE